jgi:hypothetical protein
MSFRPSLIILRPQFKGIKRRERTTKSRRRKPKRPRRQNKPNGLRIYTLSSSQQHSTSIITKRAWNLSGLNSI